MADPTAAERLRAFEDDKLGADAPRQNGQVERGHGSLFQRKLSPDEKRLHALMEQAVDAESEVQSAKLDVVEAEDDLKEIEAKIAAMQPPAPAPLPAAEPAAAPAEPPPEPPLEQVQAEPAAPAADPLPETTAAPATPATAE